jgi:hypothetical protein
MLRYVFISLALVFILLESAWAACDVRSAAHTTALVELYTSEGCSSCPPADRYLSNLFAKDMGSAQAVPLALHVDYWDDLGWVDPYANAQFTGRQRWLSRVARAPVIYTPEFYAGGKEVRGWPANLRSVVRNINATPARATIRMRGERTRSDTLSLSVQATASAANTGEIYILLTEDGLTSRVARGENSGRVLQHDHVVRRMFGPEPLANGAATINADLPALQGLDPARLRLVAFVQDGTTGEILQAVSADRCFTN